MNSSSFRCTPPPQYFGTIIPQMVCINLAAVRINEPSQVTQIQALLLMFNFSVCYLLPV